MLTILNLINGKAMFPGLLPLSVICIATLVYLFVCLCVLQWNQSLSSLLNREIEVPWESILIPVAAHFSAFLIISDNQSSTSGKPQEKPWSQNHAHPTSWLIKCSKSLIVQRISFKLPGNGFPKAQTSQTNNSLLCAVSNMLHFF